MMTFGSLFAGIGGLDLRFERAGMTCRWQVEIDDYATKVLAKHWPNVHRERDIRECGAHNLERVDVICGGFPCQDISQAGTLAGLSGRRSGLFYEAIRVVRELQPRILVLENVAALLIRGMDSVLRELAEIGLDAEWCCIPAAGVGAPHVRDRVFVAAYPNSIMERSRVRIFDANNWVGPVSPGEYRERAKALGWEMEAAPRVSRVDDGISSGVDRRRCLGNAVVPQVAEWIGRRVVRLLTAEVTR